MKKQVRLMKLLWIIFALLAALTAALCFAAPARLAGELPAAVQELAVTDIKVSEVGAVALQNAKGSLGLLIGEQGVEPLEAPPGSYSQQRMTALVYYISHMKAHQAIDPEPGQSYGLESPAASATLLLTDGSKTRLSLGAANGVDGSYYLQKEGDPKIYLVEAAAAEMLGQGLDDFRDLAVLPPVNEQTLPLISKITVETQDARYTVSKVEGSDSLYQLTEPVQAALDWEQVEEKLLLPLAALVPDSLTAADAPLTDYGLDRPSYTVTVEYDGKSYRAGFAVQPDQSAYCADLTGRQICRIAPEKLAFFAGGYPALLGDSIYNRSITEIARLDISGGETHYSIEVSGSGENLTGRVNGKSIGYVEMGQLYKSLSAIPMAEQLSAGQTVAGEPLLTISVTLRDGGLERLEFIPISDRQCAVSINGKADFSTYRVTVKDIQTSLDKKIGV